MPFPVSPEHRLQALLWPRAPLPAGSLRLGSAGEAGRGEPEALPPAPPGGGPGIPCSGRPLPYEKVMEVTGWLETPQRRCLALSASQLGGCRCWAKLLRSEWDYWREEGPLRPRGRAQRRPLGPDGVRIVGKVCGWVKDWAGGGPRSPSGSPQKGEWKSDPSHRLALRFALANLLPLPGQTPPKW